MGSRQKSRKTEICFSTFPMKQEIGLTYSCPDIVSILLRLPRFASHLRRLRLGQNFITTLDDKVFHPLTKLKELDMYDNKLKTVGSSVSTTGHSVSLRKCCFQIDRLIAALVPLTSSSVKPQTHWTIYLPYEPCISSRIAYPR
ncbi:hypothetical protein C8J56DRAFT_489482 [Mycena floridula]|nr:hypothetical protein C8J56DRAFT_489482 [Mycena floridula]